MVLFLMLNCWLKFIWNFWVGRSLLCSLVKMLTVIVLLPKLFLFNHSRGNLDLPEIFRFLPKIWLHMKIL